jgi:hypothetical protein
MLDMLKSILNYFSNLSNPTREWPEAIEQPLIYDMRYKTINNIPLSSQLKSVSQIGRCNIAKRIGKEYLELHYKERGFILEFESKRLFNVKIVLESKSHDAKVNKIKPSPLTIINMSGRVYKLTGKSKIADLKQCFGEPTDTDEDDIYDESILFFEGGGNLVECYHDRESGDLLQIEIGESDQ